MRDTKDEWIKLACDIATTDGLSGREKERLLRMANAAMLANLINLGALGQEETNRAAKVVINLYGG